MKIEFEDQKMLLANVNARSEVHGEEREPAGDLKFECDVDSGVLACFHPALKSLLYHFDESRDADLADQGKKHEAGWAPHLRMPSLEPLKWAEEMSGATLVLRIPGTKKEINLDPVKVNNFMIEPRDGGTVSLSFRVQAHPDERKFGVLCTLIQSEVEVTLAEGETAGGVE